LPDAAPSRPDVFVTVAELSADQHAAGLVRELLKARPHLTVHACGGRELEAAGARLVADTVTKARMGLGAFLRTFEVLKLLRETRRRFEQHGPPRLMICCDSWTMNKHFAKLAKEFGVPVLYYISPQVWASREKRTRKMAVLIDRLACILPFEEAWLRERGVDATFVGHPLFDELPEAPPPRQANEPPVIALPAGSRRKVASDNFPRQLEVARQIRKRIPGARFVTPTVAATDAVVRANAAGLDWIEVRLDAFNDTVASADLAICVSGTATLHCVALHTPTIAVYYVRKWQWHVFKHVVKTRTFVLVNLLHPSRRHVVPEYVPWFGRALTIADEAVTWLNDPAKMAERRERQIGVVEPLRRKGAGANAATMAMELLDANATHAENA